MAKTLHGMCVKRKKSVASGYAITRGEPDFVILAQPEGAPAASSKQPVCPHSKLISEMARIAGISFNARSFCIRFTDDAIPRSHEVGFSACMAVRAELVQLCKTEMGRQKVVGLYHQVYGVYPWTNEVEVESLPTELDVAFACPYWTAHSFDSLPLGR